MPRTWLFASVAVALLLVLFLRFLPGPEPLTPAEDRALVEWLTCDECADGELTFVVNVLGLRALSTLQETLLQDRLAMVENARAAIARNWSATPIPGGDSAQYVAHLTGNYDAQIRKRAVVALAALGDTLTLRLAWEREAPIGFRGDVLAAIDEARRAVRAPGVAPLIPERIILRPDSLVLTVGDSASLEALGRTGDDRRALGVLVWQSLDTGVVSVTSPGPGHGRIAALAPGQTEVTATLGGVSAAARVTVLPPAPALPPVGLVLIPPP